MSSRYTYTHRIVFVTHVSRTQVPSIQQSAALALGRLANHSDDLAEDVVANEILPQLVYSLGEQNVCLLLFYCLFFFIETCNIWLI